MTLWRSADFLKLWSAQTLSQFTGQIGSLAIPLVAIAVLEASAFQVGLLATAITLPFLLFSLPVGVWVDRLPRRPVLVAADLGAGLALATIPLAIKAVRGVRDNYDDPYALMPAMAKNIQLHLFTGLLIFVGYLIAIGADRWMDAPPAFLT